jgi:hypothetical protein
MKFLLNFSLFESLLLDEAKTIDHFNDRYDLRSNFQFVGGTEGLSEEDLVFAKKKILEHLRECKLNMLKYKYPRTNYEYTTVFHFGDIVLKKGDNLYYPTLSVPKEKTGGETYEGSVYGAVAHGDFIYTLMLFQRRCEGCKNPIPTGEMLAKANVDMEYKATQTNLRSYQVVAAEETGTEISPKVKIIDLDSPERYKENTRREFTVTRDPSVFNKLRPQFQIGIKTGNKISYLNKDGQKVTKEILDYQRPSKGDSFSGIRMEFKPDIGTNLKGSKIFNIGTEIISERGTDEMGYRDYVSVIIDMPNSTRDGDIFMCRTLRPFKGDI